MASLGNIVTVAEQLLAKLGKGAPELIEARALAHADEGNFDCSAYWQRVAKAIRYLLSLDPAYALAGKGLRPILVPDHIFRQVFDWLPDPAILLQPNRVIVGVNRAYEALSWRSATDLIGGDLFSIFPDNPADAEGASEKRLAASMLRVLETGAPDHLPIFRHDVINAEGKFEERWWDTTHAPILDDTGRIDLILHQTREVTALVKGEPSRV